MKFVGDGVVATASPRMTSQDASAGQIEAFEGAMFLDGIDGITRTSRCITARRRKHRRNDCPVEIDGYQEQVREYRVDDRKETHGELTVES